MNEEIFHDTEVFATYTYLARLLATEDIIVRWNMRGLDGPAEMNMVRRTLDFAPIKRGKEQIIPGLTFHEVGHFLDSDDLSKKLNGHLVAVDEAAYELFVNMVKSKYVWNIIEDGYIERKMVARFPGTLKHFRVLYDDDKANYKPSGNIVIDTLNTLHLNVLGSKWNERFPYDPSLPKKLIEKLHKASRNAYITTEARAELASDILTLLTDLPGWNTFSSTSNEGESSSGSRTTTAVDELGAVVVGSARRGGQIPSRKAGTDIEEQQEIDGDEEQYAIEEFISDNAAKILGSNKYYLETIVDRADPNGRELYVPTPDEVRAVSDITDIWHPALKKTFKGWTFQRFVTHMQSNPDGRRLYSLFSKKQEQARGIAQTMFQQFITRANAQNLAKRTQKQSGLLDTNRLALYQINDDVFIKKTMSPNQVNHAYVVMVDWSSSMHDSAMELFHRIVEMIFFAKLAKVELDIWLYTTNDRMVRGEHIEAVAHKLRDNTLLTGSIFAQIVNTTQHSMDEILFRLMFFFVNALLCKKIATDTVRGAFKWCTEIDIPSTIYIPMSGTNNFEAIVLGTERARKLNAERKAVILLTDGDDTPTFNVIMDKGNSSFATDTQSAKQVMYKGIDLLKLAEAAQVEVESEEYKYGSENPFKNLRIGATYLVAEESRKSGIPIVGITWGTFTSKPLLLITQDNTIRLNISSKTLLSKNPTTYEYVTNTFILKITEALLRHGR